MVVVESVVILVSVLCGELLEVAGVPRIVSDELVITVVRGIDVLILFLFDVDETIRFGRFGFEYLLILGIVPLGLFIIRIIWRVIGVM